MQRKRIVIQLAGDYSENPSKFSLPVLGLIMTLLCCEPGTWEGLLSGLHFADLGWNLEKCWQTLSPFPQSSFLLHVVPLETDQTRCIVFLNVNKSKSRHWARGTKWFTVRQSMVSLGLTRSLGARRVARRCELNYGQQFLETIQNGGRIPVNAVYKQLENSTIH